MSEKVWSVDVQYDDTIVHEKWVLEAEDYLRALRKAWEKLEGECDRTGRRFEFGEVGVTVTEK